MGRGWGGTVADIATGVFLVAVVFVLVRPGGHAAEAVRMFGDGVAAIVRTATDL